MKSLLITVALAAVFAAPAPGFAQTVARSAIVSTAGLDLATPSGQRRLELRLLHAASALCGTPSAADGRGRINYDACRAGAKAGAAARALHLAERARAVRVAAR